ncbi:hypothetical protein ACMD2_05001 [Ananas comosus]|uniref:Uncharacterized protein n=1 Tax=Ananas comosus TaxID=4615 RepID=A0A199UQG2_ANACO|nr:hypothetical protein ACMD2_05001 [Ananas comosus]
MKKSAEEAETGADYLEVLKAAAQAWHAQSGNPKPTSSELRTAGCTGSSAHPRRPCSRFRLEAMRLAAAADRNGVVGFYTNSSSSSVSGTWDFAQSLWDSYEIVAVSKKLEASLALDADGEADRRPVPLGRAVVVRRSGKRSRESKNSLRNLFHRVSDSKSNTVDGD